ncbi:MAG: hypothetical protein ABIH21_01110 [Patescibacteria group bacterium]
MNEHNPHMQEILKKEQESKDDKATKARIKSRIDSMKLMLTELVGKGEKPSGNQERVLDRAMGSLKLAQQYLENGEIEKAKAFYKEADDFFQKSFKPKELIASDVQSTGVVRVSEGLDGSKEQHAVPEGVFDSQGLEAVTYDIREMPTETLSKTIENALTTLNNVLSETGEAPEEDEYGGLTESEKIQAGKVRQIGEALTYLTYAKRSLDSGEVDLAKEQYLNAKKVIELYPKKAA